LIMILVKIQCSGWCNKVTLLPFTPLLYYLLIMHLWHQYMCGKWILYHICYAFGFTPKPGVTLSPHLPTAAAVGQPRPNAPLYLSCGVAPPHRMNPFPLPCAISERYFCRKDPGVSSKCVDVWFIRIFDIFCVTNPIYSVQVMLDSY
jgi:hypothetical protein